jgi:hypothetical protein
MTSQIELLDRALAKRSLAEFVRQAWPILVPRTKLVWNPENETTYRGRLGERK